jgi:hypothetical protein
MPTNKITTAPTAQAVFVLSGIGLFMPDAPVVRWSAADAELGGGDQAAE